MKRKSSRAFIYIAMAALATSSIASQVVGDAPVTSYDSDTRTLRVTTSANRSFKYCFNIGGAVSGLYDIDIDSDTNLVGESFQGETTDRVIQWTYWNSRYIGSSHAEGDGDTRANVTMEGCFHGKLTCDVLESPKSGQMKSLAFRSRIRHWFYSELDKHGQPDFETTSEYKILNDGSLRLDRKVLRKPWKLQNITVKTWDGKQFQESKSQDTSLVAEQLWRGSMTSYFESWTPLRHTIMPYHRPGRGNFTKDGYQFWKPQDIGGWAMAYGDKLAVAVVFGETETNDSKYKTRVVFNKQDLPQHKLNVLLPGIETDWPDNTTLHQTLIFVVGEPTDVADRANRLVSAIPFPEISIN